jgi:Zn-finger nucleic acid-binding protein
MTALTYERSRVVVHKCTQCHGIWLSHAHFEAIIKYLEKIVDKESASELTKDGIKQFEKVFTKQEDKISEIKDFLAVLRLLEMRMAVEHPTLAKAAQKIYEYSPIK